MAKWLLVVGTKCADAARKNEFKEWYDKTHLPDVLETPGFVRGTRYENIQPAEGQAEFLSIYEIETDDIDSFMKAHTKNMDRKRAEGRFSELLIRVSRGYYRQATSLTK